MPFWEFWNVYGAVLNRAILEDSREVASELKARTKWLRPQQRGWRSIRTPGRGCSCIISAVSQDFVMDTLLVREEPESLICSSDLYKIWSVYVWNEFINQGSLEITVFGFSGRRCADKEILIHFAATPFQPPNEPPPIDPATGMRKDEKCFRVRWADQLGYRR